MNKKFLVTTKANNKTKQTDYLKPYKNIKKMSYKNNTFMSYI